ncbi:hypothetical protein vseg_018174 [Gypsophila vaccaria]
MIYGFWNVRGMNRRKKQVLINIFLLQNKVEVFGLLETKIKPENSNKVISSINNWSITTNSSSTSGGRIWVLWNAKAIEVEIYEYDPQFIHLKIVSRQTKEWMFLTYVYAFNGIQERVPLWVNLMRLAWAIRGPWAIGGDFNRVLSPEEIVGGHYQHRATDPFRDCLHRCEGIDSPAMGAAFTWNNKQDPDTRSYRKLDRMLVNQEWMIKYDQYISNFLPEGYFDHSPCIVHQKQQFPRPNRPFKYYNMWSKDERFSGLVQ